MEAEVDNTVSYYLALNIPYTAGYDDDSRETCDVGDNGKLNI